MKFLWKIIWKFFRADMRAFHFHTFLLWMTCVCFCTPIRKAAYTIPLGLRLLEGFFLLGAITPHFFVSSILFVFMTVVILVVVVAFHVLPAPCHCYSCASKYAAFLHSSQVRILLLHSLSYEARESVIYLKLFLRNLFSPCTEWNSAKQ